MNAVKLSVLECCASWEHYFYKECGLIGHLIFTLRFNLHGLLISRKFKFPPLSPFLA